MSGPRTTLPALENRSATPRTEAGGLAVINGVLIRSRTGYSAAVRRADGAIVVRQVPFRRLIDSSWCLRLPFLRGFTSLLEFLVIGTAALQWSGEVADGGTIRSELPSSVLRGSRLSGWITILWSTLALLALVLALPELLASAAGYLPFIHNWAVSHGTLGFSEENHPIAFNLLAGTFRLLVLLAYIALIALNSDVRRVLAYHGAEHQAVADYEAGGELTSDTAETRPIRHPRCGTGFLAITVLLSAVVFALADGALAGWVTGYPDLPFWQRKATGILLHALLLPLVAGTAWEMLKICSLKPQAWWARTLLAPGMWLQRLTTRQPLPDQLEVALIALRAALDIPADRQLPRTYLVRGLQTWSPETPPVRIAARQEVTP